MPTQLTLTGSIIDQSTGQPLSGLKVQIWGTAQPSTSPLANATTDSRGKFVVQLALESQDLAQAIQFKILQDGRLLVLVENNIRWGGRTPNHTVTIPVLDAVITPDPDPEEGEYVVQGKVLKIDGAPVAGAEVEVVARMRWQEEVVGTVSTDGDGSYKISYERPECTPSFNLVVRAYDELKKNLFASSSPLANPERAEKVDVVNRKYEELVLDLDYASLKKSPGQLEQEGKDISGLRGKARQSTKQAVFGSLRRRASEELAVLLDRMETTLDDSAIPEAKDLKIDVLKRVECFKPDELDWRLSKEKESLLVELGRVAGGAEELTVEAALQTDVPLSENPLFYHDVQRAHLRQVSTGIQLGDSALEAVLGRFGSLAAVHDGALDELVKANAFSKEEASAFGLNLSIYRLVDESDVLTAAIRGSSDITEIRDLARLGKEKWEDLVRASGTELAEGKSLESYAGDLRKRAERIYPSAGLYGRLTSLDSAALTANLHALEPVLHSRGTAHRRRGLTGGKDAWALRD